MKYDVLRLFFYLAIFHSGHNWPIVPAPDVRLWWLWSNSSNEHCQGKQKYSEKNCSVPFCPQQIPHDQTWARTRAAAMGSQWQTAWVMARLLFIFTYDFVSVLVYIPCWRLELLSSVPSGLSAACCFSHLVTVVLSDGNLAIIPSGPLIVGELPDG
jgi:hypothetical protein